MEEPVEGEHADCQAQEAVVPFLQEIHSVCRSLTLLYGCNPMFFHSDEIRIHSTRNLSTQDPPPRCPPTLPHQALSFRPRRISLG